MVTSLSYFVDNFKEETHKIKCKYCDCFLEYASFKDNSIRFKCSFCNNGYSNKIDEELKNTFKNTFKFSNNHINKFNLNKLLRNNVYLYEYMSE